MNDLIAIIVSVLFIVGGYFWRRSTVQKINAAEKLTKKLKSRRRLGTWLIVIGGYILITTLIPMLFGAREAEELNVTIAPERINFLGMNMSETVVYSWFIIAILIILALILRVTVINRLKDLPSGAQNVLEALVETALKYTHSTAHGVGEFMGSYIFTVAVFLVGCAITELFGLRTPASDITLTAALAIITFFFINFYGFKVKGFSGRIQSMSSPTPVVFPIRIITDLAIPVSLACRLFGNMLGGLVVMDMLYNVLGSYAIGIPSVFGLFFNVFHPLIQAFIFVTLTLNFINEATE